ncbi:hypothetical protein [Variovorax soli]|uniref:Uncharacterized protein n=1 Tax=Variovorax soli TaxID=376815 RepID=A0ABU1NGY9_9BURK|nr:hypothetical protein [Variovorax soli]MDR6537722.1 hypothetical protein [Variovorax soli]
MPSIPSTPSILISNQTSLSELQNFMQGLNKNSELHGKRLEKGTYMLYVSKGKRTGFQQTFSPQTIETRRISARAAILKVAKNSRKTIFRTNLISHIESGLEIQHLPKEKQHLYDYEVIGSKPLVAESFMQELEDAVNAEATDLETSNSGLIESGKSAFPSEAVKALGFHFAKGINAGQTDTCSHYFKDVKNVIYEISPKSSDELAKELFEDGITKEPNIALMDSEDLGILGRCEAEAKVIAEIKEAALENTEQNKFAKLWKKIQEGMDLLPKDKVAYGHFETTSFEFQDSLQEKPINVNVGMRVLGVGVDLDRSFNLVLDGLSKIVTESIQNPDFDLKKAETDVRNLVEERKNFETKLAILQFGANMLTNDGYLKKLSKEMREPLKALGYNMARTANIFNEPHGQYQSLQEVLEAAETDPLEFIAQVCRELEQQEPLAVIADKPPEEIASLLPSANRFVSHQRIERKIEQRAKMRWEEIRRAESQRKA